MPDATTSGAFDEIISNSEFVGGVYEMDYQTCIVETDDHIKRRICGGLPRNSLLLARMRAEMTEEKEDEDIPEPQLRDHILLLRVQGPTDLPIEAELNTARFQNIGERIVSEVKGEENAHDLDTYTKRELQKTAVEADILGTLYIEDGEIQFGSDAHTTFPSAEYLVYKPSGELLGDIINDHAANDVRKIDALKIGHVRYASSQLRSDAEQAPVEVDTSDLIGLKTAVLGMTRTGKSNTLKVIASAIHVQQPNVGQLIFDPSGEYANINQQGTAIVELQDYEELESDIQKFIYGGGDGDELESNLLDLENIEYAKSEAEQLIRSKADNVNYLDTFLSVDLVNPERVDYGSDDEGYRQQAHDRRNAAAFHAVLSRAGLRDSDYGIKFSMGEDVRECITGIAELPIEFAEVDGESDDDEPDEEIRHDGELIGKVYGGKLYLFDLDGVEALWRAVANHQSQINDANDSGNWIDEDLQAILRVLTPSGNETGYNYLAELDEFHNPQSEEASAEKIYDHLCDGDTVVVDMSNGRESVVSHQLESIVQWILNRSERRFANGADLPDIQIFLEEAHRYFAEDRFSTGNDDTYVRLAKEGAKYELGLVYATQEVSTVDDRVLANTANWIVTHLNSASETKQLADYYDFEAFKHSIRHTSDKGYARLRMNSDRFTLPVQIEEFTEEWIESVVLEA